MAALRLPPEGSRARKLLAIAGYVALALVTFVLALQLTFPYDRVKARIEHELAAKYVVTIGDVERGWVPGRVYFHSVALQTRPEKVGDPISTLYLDRVMIDVGLLPLLRSTAAVRFEAQIGPGELAGRLELSKTRTAIHITGEDLLAQTLPMREVIGLPMSGTLELRFDLELPTEAQKSGRPAPNWQKAEGGAELACPSGCTFGDGKSRLKMKLKNQRAPTSFGEDGIEFGTITATSIAAQVEIKAGQLTLTRFDAKSEDAQLHVEYAMELQPSFSESMVTGCLRFLPSQALLKRDAKTFTALSATGAMLGPDQLYHIRLTDKLKDMKRFAQSCGPGVPKRGDSGGAAPRPTLSAPSEPARAREPAAPTYVPPPLPDAAPPIDAAVAVPVPGPDLPGSAHSVPAGSAGPPSGGPAADAIR
jgi:type II secretion system protein N